MTGSWARLTVDAGVATITLAAPSGPSRINVRSAREWYEAVRAADADETVRAIVVRADGPVWSAGGDLAEFREHGEEAHDLIREIGAWVNPLALLLHETDKVTVASVHGAVAGGGVGLMAACDLVLAAAGTVLTLGYARLATNPDAGGSWFLPRRIGYRAALELYLTSDRLTAEQALALGLITRVVADAELEAQTTAFARRIAALPAHATAATKRLLRTSADVPLAVQLDAEIRGFADHTRHPDFAEGVAAFLDRRAPRWAE